MTNGFRSQWGRDFYAAVRSVIGTGQRANLSPFQAIQNAPAAQPVGGIELLPG